MACMHELVAPIRDPPPIATDFIRRCRDKYVNMSAGMPPASMTVADPEFEPLVLWLPKLLNPGARMSDDARKEFCDSLMLRQDDAWKEVVAQSV